MKLRTGEELTTHLDTEIGWRKIEIDTLTKLVRKQKEGPKRDTFLRAGVAMLYAHFEGFTKNAVSFYVKYVEGRRLPIGELSQSFCSLVCVRLIQRSDISQKDAYMEMVDIVRKGVTRKYRFASVVDIGNLDYDRFAKLMNSVGLDSNKYATMRLSTIDRLVELRNPVAHGRWEILDCDRFLAMCQDVLNIMNEVKNDIENAEQVELYKS